MAPRFERDPFARAGAILSCICFTAILAAPAISQASPIAIISKQHDSSDAFSKVVGALCEKKGKDDEREDEQSFCRHFEDDREVSSLLMQNAEAFAAIVTEVRVLRGGRGGVPVSLSLSLSLARSQKVEMINLV